MGYFDDKSSLPAVDKIFFQAVCTTAMVSLDPALRQSLMARYGVEGTFFCGFFIFAMMNAINFVDGINGLAAIVLWVGSMSFCLIASQYAEQTPFFLFCSVICGVLVPFFYFNAIKGKAFLGNIGSYYFSFILTVIHLSLPLPNFSIFPRMSIIILCFIIPVADASLVVIQRMWYGRSPFQADKGHLHHRLMQAHIPLRYVLLTLGMIELFAAYLAIEIASGSSLTRLSFFVVCVFVLTTATLIFIAERGSRKRVQAYFKRLDSGGSVYYLKYKIRHKQDKPVESNVLRRLEDGVSAEIRVTDFCLAENPDTLFIILRTANEPLKGISSRLETVFQAERAYTFEVIERGEFVKVPEVEKLAAVSPVVKQVRGK
jgi:hypothetical protein